MCIFLPKTQTIEELIVLNSLGMTSEQKAQYWYEINTSAFELLGKIDVNIYPISKNEWIQAAQEKYPTLTDVKFADSQFWTTDLNGLDLIIIRDWSNLVKYEIDISDCDKYGIRLYEHLCRFYKINAVVPVWGHTDAGYHGFNLAVVKHNDTWIAKLIEPQKDKIFDTVGMLGTYTPEKTAEELGVLKIE